MLCLNVADEVQAITVFERDVDDNQVRLEPGHIFERSVTILLLTANHQVMLLIDKPRQSVPSYRVIIHQQDAHPMISPGTWSNSSPGPVYHTFGNWPWHDRSIHSGAQCVSPQIHHT